MTELAERLARILPKAELHVHLEGSMSPTRAEALCRREGIVLERSLDDGPAFESFEAFIRLYLVLSASLARADDFRDLTVDLGERLAEQQVRYAEVTFTPMTHVARGLAAADVIAGLVEGRAEVAARCGVQIRWVFDVVRSFPDQAAPTLSVARDMLARDPDGMVGLGVGGPEAGVFDMGPIADMFAQGRLEGLHSLPHAGEVAGASSVWTAIDQLGAERLGHGIRCLEDPELVARLCDRGIPLEVCPTSNVLLGVASSLEAHPLPRLLEAGLSVVLGSDDPGLFATDVVEEFVRCVRTFGWSPADVLARARASIDHAFMSPELAATLRAEQDRVFEDLRSAPSDL